MGKQLNIKNVGMVELARRLADKLGGSVTAAIRTAVEDKMAAIMKAEAKPSVEEALEMV